MGTPGPTGTEGPAGRPGPRGLVGPSSAAARTQLLLPGSAFYPEGITATRDGSIFTGSLPTGELLRFAPGASTAQPFAETGGFAAGLLADDDRGLLFACVSAPDFASAKIAVLDLQTGASRGDHRIPYSPAFCNDLTLDDAGNLYATESLQQKIVRVIAAAIEDTSDSMVWAEGEAFATPANQFGLNGIAFDHQDRIFAGNYTTGAFYRIAIESNGAAGTIETISLGRPLAGLDGLKAIDATTFLATEQFGGRLSKITLTARTATTGSITAIANQLDTPTTFAIFDESAWIVEGQLDHFLGYDPNPPKLPFRIARVPLGLDLQLPLGPSKLAGHWTSEACEALPPGLPFASISRDFAISDHEWSLLLTFFADTDCATAILDSDIIGPYRLGARSAAIAGATEGDFGYRSIRFSAYDPALIAQLESNGCGSGEWEIGVPKEVGSTGCLGIAPKIADCPFDHDVVKVDGDRLYFGQRGAEMCAEENRPTALNTAAVVRR